MKIKIKKDVISDEIGQIKAIAMAALNFQVYLFESENKYKCIPVDEGNIFNFWYVSKDIRKDSPIAACYYLIEQYEYFTKLDKSKIDKIIKELNVGDFLKQILPQFSFLPLNSEYLSAFKENYDNNQRDKSIEKNIQNYVVGDTNFGDKILKMGYVRLITESDKLIFRLLDSPVPEIEIIDAKIRIGISEPRILHKSDLIALKWFAKLGKEDRRIFNIISFEDMKFHLNEQMKISGQLRGIKDLNSWVIDRYERSDRSTKLFLSITDDDK